MKKNNKQFTTVRSLTNKVNDLEKRCEEIELILIALLQEKKL
mgnify:CR=1 FL=1|tara:strand:+ start:2350 stop:2475 length:126 start_codon:yes stop_codon:yes gene_type:complete